MRLSSSIGSYYGCHCVLKVFVIEQVSEHAIAFVLKVSEISFHLFDKMVCIYRKETVAVGSFEKLRVTCSIACSSFKMSTSSEM